MISEVTAVYDKTTAYTMTLNEVMEIYRDPQQNRNNNSEKTRMMRPPYRPPCWTSDDGLGGDGGQEADDRREPGEPGVDEYALPAD